MNNLINQTIKGYEVRELVGAGGFGAVYRAMQPSIGREVAIKVILPEHANQSDFVRRFEIEAQLIARLEHPHIVPLYDYWRDPQGAFLVMRWLRGNLRASLQKGSWSLEAAARLLEHVSGALTVAHREGVIHRDIKPDNILLDEDDNAYLADFGIAKDTNVGSMTDEGTLVGSPAYITPEQIKGEPLTARTDIYSLGLVLYEILANETAFPEAKTPAELIAKHLNTPIPRLHLRRPNLPAAIDEVLGTATAKDSNQRYTTVARFATAFRAALPLLQRAAPQPLAEALTERELDILRLMIEDLSNQQIAERLYLSAGTVKWYSKQIYAKLDVHTRHQAVERARALNLFGDKRATSESNALLVPATLLDPQTINAPAPATPIIVAAQNPYKGLRAFRESDAPDFFGRAALVEGLLTRMSDSDEAGRFLVISGPSGSGKSSAVRAGLIPALRSGGLPDSERWFITEMIPGSHPFEELEAALLRVAVNPLPSLLSQLTEDRRGLVRAAKRVLPADQDVELVIVIDQFEELFTLIEDDRMRRHFIDNLLSAATDPRGRVRLILTLRADFYDKPLIYPRLAELVRRHTEFILPLNDLELERAIVGPAERIGITMETGLVAAIVREVGEQVGALPLLQYALTELFEQRTVNMLTLDAYRETGGIVGALARRADALYDELDEMGQQACRQLFLRLVTLGEGMEDTRRRVLQSELDLLDSDSSMDEVINAFARYRLLTLDHDPVTRGSTVEVAHEALIRTWDRLRGWIVDAREEVRIQRRLSASATEWTSSGRDSSFLADGARLTQFEALATSDKVRLNADERLYVQASVDERDRKQQSERERQQRELTLAQQAATSQRRSANRLRYLVAVLIVFLLVAGALSGVAINSANQLKTSLNLSEAQRLALESVKLHSQFDNYNELSALLAIRSVSTTYTPQGDNALVSAAQLNYPITRLTLGEQFPFSVWGAYAPNGSMFVTTHADIGDPSISTSELWLWDAHTFQPLRQLEGSIPTTWTMLWTQDSKYVLAAVGRYIYEGAEVAIHMWEAGSGHLVRRFLIAPDKYYETMALTSDGKELYAVVLNSEGQYMIRYWDVQTGLDLRSVKLPFTGRVQALGQRDPNYRVWLSRPTRESPDELAIVITPDKIVQLWDIRHISKIRDFEGSGDSAYATVFSPSQRYVAMSIPTNTLEDSDFIVQVWEVNSGAIKMTFPGYSGGGLWPEHFAFSNDDHYLLVGNNGNSWYTDLWNLTTEKSERHWYTDGTSVGISPDGETIILVLNNIGVVEIYRRKEPTLPQKLPHPDRVRGVAISHDGKLIATAGGDRIIRLWDAETYAEVGQLIGHLNPVTEVKFSPDDRYLLSTAWNDGYRLWDVQTKQQVWEYTGEIFNRFTPAFSSDGKYMIAIESDKQKVNFEIQVVEIWNGTIVSRTPLPEDTAQIVNCAKFSSDDHYIALMKGGGWNKTLLWDWHSDKPPLELVNDIHIPARCGAFSPDGKYLLLGGNDGILRLYDISTGTEVRRFLGDTGSFLEVAFSTDGSRFVTSNDDRTVRVWDYAIGKEIRRFTFEEVIWGVALSPDGKTVVIGSFDGNGVYVLHTDLSEEIKTLCAKLSRDFTPQERITYDIKDDKPSCPTQ